MGSEHLSVIFLLRPFAGNPVLLYLTGAFIATVFEYLVGRAMLRIFGEVWWDYREKPFNYQGHCLPGKYDCLGILCGHYYWISA